MRLWNKEAMWGGKEANVYLGGKMLGLGKQGSLFLLVGKKGTYDCVELLSGWLGG